MAAHGDTASVSDDDLPDLLRSEEHAFRDQFQASTRLMNDDKYADLTITCKGETFRVHRAVVCPRCKFFEACCEGGFKEAREGVIDLPEDDPRAVKLMLEWLYTYNLPKWDAIVELFGGKISEALVLYLTADKYGLGGLAEAATKNVVSDVGLAILCLIVQRERSETVLRNLGRWRTKDDLIELCHQVFECENTALDALKQPVLDEMRLHFNYKSIRDANFKDTMFTIPEIAKNLYEKAIEDLERTKTSLQSKEKELREKDDELRKCRQKVLPTTNW